MDNKAIQEIIKDRAIAYRALLAKSFDSVPLAIFWEQLRYWTDRTRDKDGWIYKTSSEVYDETGLSRRVQETARQRGIELGILEEKIEGYPATLRFRINMDRACVIIGEWIEKNGTPKPIKRDKPTNSIEWLKNISVDEMDEIGRSMNVSVRFVRARANDVIDYCEANGKKYSNYKAALRNFIKSHKGEKEVYGSDKVVKKPWEEDKPLTEEQRRRAKEKLDEIKKNFGLMKSIPR